MGPRQKQPQKLLPQRLRKRDDREIAAVETTMSELSFSEDDEGLVLISDRVLARAKFQATAVVEELPSILALRPPTPNGGGNAAMLPMEILCQMLDFVPRWDQETFASASKVCRQWYLASSSYLYCYPKITSRNYSSFVATICPSSTNIKPSPLANLVRRLDLSHIVHESKPSFVARLLRRTQGSLEEFIAPQASFGYICLVALGHCRRLRLLDLSLVSQSVSLENLFTHIQDLPNLLTLYFPRSSVFDRGKVEFRWPARIEKFALAGGISDSFLINASIPPTLQELHISHCPFTKHNAIRNLLNRLSQQLVVLSINYHLPWLPYDAFDKVLVICPNLTKLLVAVDYISNHFFDEENTPAGHPLRKLELDSSGYSGIDHKVSPDDIYIAVSEDRLSELRQVRVSKKLGWTEKDLGDVRDLVDLLEEKASHRPDGRDEIVGVWEFEEYVPESQKESFSGYLGG